MSVCLRPKSHQVRVRAIRPKRGHETLSLDHRAQGRDPTTVQVGGRPIAVNLDRLEASICRESLEDFVKRFWNTVPELECEELLWNWHMSVLCGDLQEMAERVFRGEEKLHDLLINIPPGTSKTLICSVLFPAWVWTRMPSARFICGSYAEKLAQKSALNSRDVILSEKYKRLFGEIKIREDQGGKSLFANQSGGYRLSIGTGGGVTGFHAHFIVIDDPINPEEAHSEADLETKNRWVGQTMSRRKVSSKVSVTIMVMQRLHQNDPAAVMLEQASSSPVRHLKFPAEIHGNGMDQVRPRKYVVNYVNGLLDPRRLSQKALSAALTQLGQFGYSGQMLQNPVPLGGGMFKVDKINVEEAPPRSVEILRTCRSWDKAGTKGAGANTAGGKLAVDRQKRFWILDMVRGQWDSSTREKIIRDTAKVDGPRTEIVIEQEPGSGGKESAENTVKNLAGYSVTVDRPTGSEGSKALRADPFSVQVNIGNVYMVRGPWNQALLQELRHFPHSKYKDQADALSGAFNKLNKSRVRIGGLGKRTART